MTLALVKTEVAVVQQTDHNCQSYVGRQHTPSEAAFCHLPGSSEFLQEKRRREQLYSSINSEQLTGKIQNSFTVQNCPEIRSLDDLLSPSVDLLDNSLVNPLDSDQKRKVKFILDLFSRKIFARTMVLQSKFTDLSSKLSADSKLSHKYLQEKLTELDKISLEFLWWGQRVWLNGSLKVKEDAAIRTYAQLAQQLTELETGFCLNYLPHYRSTIFSSLPQLDDERKYVQSLIKEQLGDATSLSTIAALRLQYSLPGQLSREFDLIRQNIDYYSKIKIFARQMCEAIEKELALVPLKATSRDYLRELAGKYRPLLEQFREFPEAVLYCQQDIANHERAVEQLHRLVREKELDLEKRLAQERAGKESKVALGHPLVIRPAQFDISQYLEKHHPQNQLFIQLHKLVSQNITWEDKLDQFPVLLRQPPQFYSQADHAYLQDLEFALRTSLQEGVLGYLSQENVAFKNKVLVVIDQLQEYAHNYRLNI